MISVYVDALKTVWQVAIAFSCLAFFCVFIEKHIELRKELNTEFGLEEKDKNGVATQEKTEGHDMKLSKV